MTTAATQKKRTWIIRAGYQAEIVSEFLEKNIIAIGWKELGDFKIENEWQSFRNEVKKHLPPDYSEQRIGAAAGQLWTFIHEIKVHDYVVTPDKHAREVHVGLVTGEYKYDSNLEYPRTRKVKWFKPLEWDSLPAKQRQSFTAWQTIHQPEADFSSVIAAAENPKISKLDSSNIETPTVEKENLSERAEEAIRERLRRISPLDFQRLVGAVLKAAGFVILLDSAGSGKDGGIDLIVSKDPLGAGERIIVQVKHGKGKVESKILQQLVGTLKSNEHGLMITSGGITSDAFRYWREHRDKILKPLEATDFIELLGDIYEKLDSEFKAMLPLRRTYVPLPPEED